MVTKFNSFVNTIFESANYFTTRKRTFYPKGLKLSEDFIELAKGQHKSLIKTGMHPKIASEKMLKALQFHLR